MPEFIFPLRQRPSHDYHTSGRRFRAGRSNGRKHAGCDLIAPRGTEILAMADGTVRRGPYYFYSGTYALEITHDNGKVVRYGEILHVVPSGIRTGARVTQGQLIAKVGRLNSGSSMLHLEMYSGSGSGRLTQAGNSYKRRSDLINPTPYLDAAPLLSELEALEPLPPGVRLGRANDKLSSNLNVRSEAATTAAIVFKLPRGSSCRVVEEVTGGHYAQGDQKTWYKIQQGGREGYAAAYFIDIEPGQEAPPDTEAVVPPIVAEGQISDLVSNTLNVRTEASTSADIVFKLDPGNKVKVLEETTGDTYRWDRNDWLKIEHDGKTGYAAGYFVEIDKPDQTQSGADEGAPPPDRWEQALLDAPTTGASDATARQDRLTGGIDASHKMAENDLQRVLGIASRFVDVSGKFGVPAAVLAALSSRESRCGAVLDNGWGDHNNAFGIMQVDKRFHTIRGTPDPGSVEHMEQAAGIFTDYLAKVAEKHPDWEDPFVLKGAAVAYNSGPGNVQTKEGMDGGTTGDDYGSDVMARAQFYFKHPDLSLFRG